MTIPRGRATLTAVTLREWCQTQPYGALARLARATGAARQTLSEVARDRRRLDSYALAARVAAAAPGVTVEELCTWAGVQKEEVCDGSS